MHKHQREGPRMNFVMINDTTPGTKTLDQKAGRAHLMTARGLDPTPH